VGPSFEQVRRLRVERVVAVGRRVADPCDSLGQLARRKLGGRSGLSSEGIALALEQHLECRPSSAELDRLVAGASRAERCHVLLAANVCTAALRAIACAVASAPHVTVRPSRRDPVLAETLVAELGFDSLFQEAGGSVELAPALGVRPGDLVHAYGSDETLAVLADSLPAGARLMRHGTGIGVAVVDAGAPIERAAQAIARDVVPFDQRGCLSPRFVLVEGDSRRASQLAAALHVELALWGARVPRGPLGADARAEQSAFCAIARALGPIWQGEQHLVTLDPTPSALELAPAARVVPVVPCTRAEVARLLEPWARFVAAVGAGLDASRAPSALGETVHALAPWARRSALGQMQRPPLDGPVDLRAAAGVKP
jgi:hypothetical protein